MRAATRLLILATVMTLGSTSWASAEDGAEKSVEPAPETTAETSGGEKDAAAEGSKASVADSEVEKATVSNGLGIPGDLSATVTFATDYIWRGISLTGEDVAWQSSIDYKHKSGLYAGLWGSNIDFGNSAQLELDVYGGYTSNMGGLVYDISVEGYIYPGADNDLKYDFVEVGLGISYDFKILAIDVGFQVSPDFFASTGVATHVETGLKVPLPGDILSIYDLRVDGHFGYQDIDEGGSFMHWDAGLVATIVGFDFDFRYLGFDGDDDILDLGDLTDDRFVFSFSRKF